MSGRPDGAAILAETKSRRRRARVYQVLGVLAVLAAAAGGFVFFRKKSAKSRVVRYVTAQAQVGDLKETVTATGTLKGLDSVDVGAQISGKLTKIYVDFNDHVTVGQLLAEIDTTSAQSKIDQSKAQVNAADASLVLAKATLAQNKAQYARSLDLAAKGLISSKDLDSAKADADRASASISSAAAQATLARASLKDAQTQLSYAVIRSPIDGVVLARLVEPGQTVAATMSAPVLFTIAKDLTQLRLYVDIDEADVGKVKEQQDATFLVDAWTGHNFASKVLSVHNLPTAGQTVVTYQAVLSVDNNELLLRPGMTATATITTDERKGVLLVPNAALRFSPPAVASAKTSSIPFIGGGMPGGPRTGTGSTTRTKTANNKKIITAADSQGLVYTLTNNVPQRKVVEIAGTDGEKTEIKSGLTAGTMVITDIDQRKAQVTTAPVTRPVPDDDAIIQLRNVRKVYGEGESEVRALAGIDFDITRGDFVAIMGTSGSGKSTCMNILGCLDVPTDGTYKLAGVTTNDLHGDGLTLLRRHYIGFVFQGFNLLSRTSALENVELPLVYRRVGVRDRRKAALRSLELVGLSDRADHTPQELSGGQQQRVAIARALVTDPELLLADEPTGNLDSARTQEIMNLLVDLNKTRGITIVMVTHEPDVAAYANRVVVFRDGLIVEDSRPERAH